MLILNISPYPDGQRKSFEPLGEIRNLNKSFCHAFTLLNNLGQFSCQCEVSFKNCTFYSLAL